MTQNDITLAIRQALEPDPKPDPPPAARTPFPDVRGRQDRMTTGNHRIVSAVHDAFRGRSWGSDTEDHRTASEAVTGALGGGSQDEPLTQLLHNAIMNHHNQNGELS